MLLMDCKRRDYAERGFDMGWRDEGSTDHGYREDLFINEKYIVIRGGVKHLGGSITTPQYYLFRGVKQ